MCIKNIMDIGSLKPLGILGDKNRKAYPVGLTMIWYIKKKPKLVKFCCNCYFSQILCYIFQKTVVILKPSFTKFCVIPFRKQGVEVGKRSRSVHVDLINSVRRMWNFLSSQNGLRKWLVKAVIFGQILCHFLTSKIFFLQFSRRFD